MTQEFKEDEPTVCAAGSYGSLHGTDKGQQLDTGRAADAVWREVRENRLRQRRRRLSNVALACERWRQEKCPWGYGAGGVILFISLFFYVCAGASRIGFEPLPTEGNWLPLLGVWVIGLTWLSWVASWPIEKLCRSFALKLRPLGKDEEGPWML